MPDPPITTDDPPTFQAPWQARAFAIAVALTDRGSPDGHPWTDFQTRLVEEINTTAHPADDPETAYYHQWLSALERFLLDHHHINHDEYTQRVREFHDGARDASEFVDGDPHDHDHDHDHHHPH